MRLARIIAQAVAAVLVITALGGCDYERLDIFVGTNVYEGRILTDWRGVEVTRTGIILSPGAQLSISTPETTQSQAQFEVAILEGDGMTAYLRTVSHDFVTSNGVAFRYATDGCTMRMEDGTLIPLEYNADTEQQIIRFHNEANQLAVSVGCNQIFDGTSRLENTEYVIFEALPGSTVEIRAVDFFDVYD